ncbi:MAG: hypothetical protein NC392_15895, partial [Roseburia sp.]|nr:hypothetical protein [Roseburia sp.]
ISFGIVTCPFAITFALSTNTFVNMVLHHLSKIWKVGISLFSLYVRDIENSRANIGNYIL